MVFHENQRIGEYTLIRNLGRGSFGEVWLAENAGARFAIKLPHKEQVDWKQITQEIGLWTLCGKHRNIMPLVSARNFNGQIAIISEYAPDGSLEDLLRARNKLPVKEAVEITIEILEGLQHLHENGIIHRDLKPANILFDGKTARLTDFGISRIITGDSLSETISGTWAYMAPECFDGKRNVQTDIWSVGVILYRMLRGNLPFPQKEQMSLVGAIMMREPEPLFDDTLPALQAVVSKCLSKNPAERYQVCENIAQDLKRLLPSAKPSNDKKNPRLVPPVITDEYERRLHNDARRFARLVVLEIELYNQQKVKEGREANDLYERLREAIDRSREMYDKRIQPEVTAKFDYFHYQLVEILAEGDETKLGMDYFNSYWGKKIERKTI